MAADNNAPTSQRKTTTNLSARIRSPEQGLWSLRRKVPADVHSTVAPTKKQVLLAAKYDTPLETIDEMQSCPATQATTRVFFKPLKKSTTKDTVTRVFSQFGKLQYIRLPFSKRQGKNLGYGYAVFEDDNVSTTLIDQIRQIEIDGKVVRLCRYQDKCAEGSYDFSRRIKAHVDQYVAQEEAGHSAKHKTGFDFAFTPQSNDFRYVEWTACHTRWSIHQIKPTKRSYFEIHNERSQSDFANNIQFRACLQK